MKLFREGDRDVLLVEQDIPVLVERPEVSRVLVERGVVPKVQSPPAR